MSTRSMVTAMVEQYNELMELSNRWRTAWGQPYGLAPDCNRKMVAIKVAVEAFGYRIGYSDEGETSVAYFDWRLAEQLDIPIAVWPESAVDERERDLNSCPECECEKTHRAWCSKFVECDSCGKHQGEGHVCAAEAVRG